MRMSRRPFLIGVAAAAGAAAIGGAYEAGLFRTQPKGPYGDVLASLDDLADAPALGRAYLAEAKDFDARAAAAKLRARLRHHSVRGILDADIARNQLAEAGRWVLPESLAAMCALAVSK